MSKIDRKKILIDIMNSDEMLGLYKEPNYRLVRERDGLTKTAPAVKWLEFNSVGKCIAQHNEIAVGRSLILSPFNQFFTWQTTLVTEIIEQREGYVKFATENSIYELWKIKND
jgi:hypothetical protein